MPGVRSALKSAFDRRWVYFQGAMNKRFGSRANSGDVETYRQMKFDNDQSSALYQAGAFWAQINRQFSLLIWAGKLKNLRNEFFNRRFAGPEPESRQVYKSLLLLYREALRPIDTDRFLDSEGDPLVGGTGDQEIIGGRPLSLDFLQSVEEVYRIREAWRRAGRKGEPELIVELGAGYGRVAYVARKLIPGCTYVIFDLPEALMCSSTWLSQALPGEVVPYAESRMVSRFSRELLLEHKVWTLGTAQLEAVDADTADAFLNIYSFAEMPRKITENYFDQVDRVTNGVLFSKQRRLEINTEDQERNSMEEFPVPKTWHELFRRSASLYEDFFECAWATRSSSD